MAPRISFAAIDGVKAFPNAITDLFPKAVVQTCVVYLLRYSLA